MLKREMPPVHPGTILKEMYLDPLEIGVGELADNIGVVRRTISLLVNEHSGVSAEMALRLSKTFSTTPQFWLNMQQTYDLWYAEKKVALKSIKSLSPAKPGSKIAATSKVTNLSVAKPMGNRPF